MTRATGSVLIARRSSWSACGHGYPVDPKLVNRTFLTVTSAPWTVEDRMAAPLVYHRGPGYGKLLRDVTDGVKRLFRTDNDVVVFTSSGTGGLESAVANLFSPGDRVVVVVAGYFGERFAKIARAYGLDVRTVDYEWGSAAKPEDIDAAIAEAPTKAVLVQQSETSTAA